MLKKNILHILPLLTLMLISGATKAQVNFEPVFSQMRLEARADFDYNHYSDEFDSVFTDKYGMHGRYFNLIVGGDLGDKFSYFFRQRIVANPGNVSLFDNTDFLYINYMPNANWMIRMGKDALAVGGFEYDAPPIDVLFCTRYWDYFYCFQPALAAAYKSNNGKHMILGQIGNSPYVHNNNGGADWNDGLFSYNLFYSGDFGHYKMLSSVNWFQRPDRKFMNYIAIGQKLVYDKFDIYLDLIHHAMATNDWGNNYAVVSCANWYVNKNLSFFAKGSWEQNFSSNALGNYWLTNPGMFDCFAEEDHSYCTYGLGMEFRPASCPDFRFHAYVANRTTVDNTLVIANYSMNNLMVNCGVTWNMDINRMWKDRLARVNNTINK